MTLPRRSHALAAAALLAAAAGCDSFPFAPGVAPAEPAFVRIEVAEPRLVEGDSVRLGVSVLDAARNVIELPPWITPRWTAAEGGPVVVRDDGTVISVAPGDAKVEVEIAGLKATRQLRVDPAVITMDIAGAYLVQTVQRLNGTVPIMAGRDALLRVFVQGNASVNSYTPAVHVHLFQDGVPIDTLVIPAAWSKVPHELSPGSLVTSWNALIPGDRVRPGLGMRVFVDPEGTVERTPASRTVFPHGGGIHAVDVRELPPHRVRFVPVRQAGSGTTGNINEGNAASYLSLFERLFPVPSTEIEIRAPFTTGAVVAETEGWLQLLQEINALRAAEGSSSYYYGVVQPAGGNWGGYAIIGQPVAIGYDRPHQTAGGWTWAATLFAHEVGHNFARRHAPCGSAQGIDPQYPYTGATIGVYGYDLVRGLVLDADVRDIMSYCYDWISDYTYVGAWSFREWQAARSMAASRAAAEEPVLLVWGGIDADGSLRLEPAFELVTRPAPPPEPGPYTIQALDVDGNVLFTRSFAGDEVAHAEPGTRLFAFTVPIGRLEPGAIHRLRLVGPRGAAERITSPGAVGRRPDATRRVVGTATRIDWDRSRHPMALLRDRETGHIIAFARDGTIDLPAFQGTVDVLLSHGTGSLTARVRQP
jgi:hypothetical protein